MTLQPFRLKNCAFRLRFLESYHQKSNALKFKTKTFSRLSEIIKFLHENLDNSRFHMYEVDIYRLSGDEPRYMMKFKIEDFLENFPQ